MADSSLVPSAARVLLVGGGYSHLEVLRRFALQPDPALQLALVSPESLSLYPGMMPGVIAGHYPAGQAHIDLAALARWAGARFIADRLTALDPDAKIAYLHSGNEEPFDFLSLDVGSTPDVSVPGAAAYALAMKPVGDFLAAWEATQRDAAAGRIRTVVVVGGGASGVEILLAMQHRLRMKLRDEAPRFALVTDQPNLLPAHSAAVRGRVGRALIANDVVIHLESRAIEVLPRTVVTRAGVRIAADCIVWATAAAAPPWARVAGLNCDESGFIAIDNELRSMSHPHVFAAGDCANQMRFPRPKSGVFATRQGPPLAANLRRAVHGRTLLPYVPQRHALSLISTGDRRAIVSRGGIAFDGAWVWRMKDRIDRAFVARYTPPATPPSPHAGAQEIR